MELGSGSDRNFKSTKYSKEYSKKHPKEYSKGILSFILVLFLGGAILWATLGYARASYFDYSEALQAEKMYYTSQDVEHSFILAERLGFEKGNEEYAQNVTSWVGCAVEETIAETARTGISQCGDCILPVLSNTAGGSASGLSNCIWLDRMKMCQSSCRLCGGFPEYSNIVDPEIREQAAGYPYLQSEYNGMSVSVQGNGCAKARFNSFDKVTCTARLDTAELCKTSVTVADAETGQSHTSSIPSLIYEYNMPLSMESILSGFSSQLTGLGVNVP